MDPTTQFFNKLRKLAVTLETETDKLQTAFENRNNDDDDDSNTGAKAMRAYHDLNCDVKNLKGEIQDQLTQQKAQLNEVSSFIKACGVMEDRVSEDIKRIKSHWEKYGYQAPKDIHTTNKVKGQDSEVEDKTEDENENESTEEEDTQEDAEVHHSSASPPALGAPPCADPLRTPQLSDFGLSEMQLKRALARGEWCSEAPPMPEMSLPHPSLNTPALPPMAITPKRALRMDEDELQTPQMHDFGISEHTMCLNNDFTMDLQRKNVEKSQSRPPENLLDPPVNPLETLAIKVSSTDLESPEPPVLCTPGLKIKKTNGQCPQNPQENGDPESPGCHGNLATTPEVPEFKTPYMNRLVSTKKSARKPEPIKMQSDDSHVFDLPTPPRDGALVSKRNWEYDVPDMCIEGVEDKQMPAMPNLESSLGNSLQRCVKMPKMLSECEKVAKKQSANSLDLDGLTQEFNLGTPCARRVYEEPSTPEMPDLSSVTQDICKLVSQAQLKKSTMATVHPHLKPDKENTSPLPRAATLSVVSESEFQGLPSYMRQMTLHSLNQAVQNINTFMTQCRGEQTEFQMDQMRKMINFGTKTPVFILCLTELKRLEHVKGARNTSVFKLNAHT